MRESTANHDKITVALREVFAPEFGVSVSIIDLGLVYSIRVYERRILIRMATTTLACPLPVSIRTEIDAAIRRHVPEVTEVEVELVWDPPWHPTKMSERAKRQLGWLGR